MTAIDPALAYEPGVVPEPPAEPLGLTRFLRALRDNQLAVFNRESFVNDFGEARLFFSNFVLVNEPDFIEHILVTNHRNYVKGRLTRRILQPALGNGLVTSEGDFWRRQRRIMTPAFPSPAPRAGSRRDGASRPAARRTLEHAVREGGTPRHRPRNDVAHDGDCRRGAVLERHCRLHR